MTLWLVLTMMTAFAAGIAAAPFLRDWGQAPAQQERAIYKDQLAQIQRDRARGEIGAEEAQAAALEIQRRCDDP